MQFVELVTYKYLTPANSFRTVGGLFFFAESARILPVYKEDVDHHLFDERVEERDDS